MEVFQSCGEEGVLTICLDDGETVKLNFKKQVHVSVSYSADRKENAIDTPPNLKTEVIPPADDFEKKTDPLDEELNGIIERVKNNENGNDDLFPYNTQNTSTTQEDDNDSRDVKKICVVGKDEIDQSESVNNHHNDGCHSDMEDGGCDDDFDDNTDDGDDESIDKAATTNGNLDDSDSHGKKVERRDVGVSDKDEKRGGSRVGNDGCSASGINNAAVKELEDHCEEGSEAQKISDDSKKRSLVVHKDDSLTKLVREVAEKRKSIGKTTSAAAALSRDRRNMIQQKGKLARATFFKCNLCEKAFSDSYLLSMHQRAENSKAMCKMCDLECMSKANLIIHQHLVHSKSGRTAGKKCPVCEKSFDKHSDILSHVRSEHTKEGLYKCCVCRAIFQSYQPFKSHLDAHDKDRLLKEAQNRKRQYPAVADVHKLPKAPPPAVGRKMPRMSGEPASSASRRNRKSHTPMQHLSLMNSQPPAKSTNPSSKSSNPPPSTAKPTSSSLKPSRHSVSPRAPISTSAMKTTKVSPTKAGARTPASKLIVKLPSSSSSSPSKATMPIRKEVLASRLKPLMTPSLMPNRKRPLNQVSGSIAKTVPRVALGRGPLKTLPRVSPQSRALLSKRSSSVIRGHKAADKLWKCHFCERVFRTKGDYINHKKPSRIIQLCKECGFTSTSKALYIIHQYQKHTNRGNDRYTSVNEDLRCHLCEEPIALNEVLNHVMNKHTGENPYECCVCKKQSKVYEDWVSHGKSHIRSKEEKSNLSKSKLVLTLTVKTEETVKSNELFCNLCKQYHPNEKVFIRHHKSETKKKECEVCRQTCYTEAGYLIHKYITHGLSAGETNESSTNLPSTSFSGNFKSWHEDDVENDESLESTKCPSCLESFPMKDLIPHVMNSHTEESQYKCCTCKALISNLDQYMDHCDFHLGRKLYSRGTQRCLVCGLRFESRIRLSRHKAMHKPTCSFCQEEFSSKALYDVHLKNFHTNEMTPCSFCGKLFADSKQLAEHERNHFFYKKSPCPVCGLNVTNVNKHMARVHPKPDTQFLCTICGQKFALKCDLSRHMTRTHSNDRRHECDICKKTFKRAGGLRRHAQSHLQERVFHECHICGKKCTQRNNLSVHMRVHSTTKAFTCEHCGQGFNYNQSLQTHIKRKHMEEPLNNNANSNANSATTTTGGAAPSVAVPPPPPEPAALNVRDLNPKPQHVVVTEPMNQMVSNTSSHSQQSSMVSAPSQPGNNNYHEHPSMYQPAESAQQQHYYPDPAAYVPVNASAFQRSYSDLINTIVRSEHENNGHQGAPPPPPQNYPVYYPQF